MTIRIRDFSIAIAAAAAVAVANAQNQPQEGELTVTPVRGSVHMLSMGAAGNVGVSAGPDGAFIIDDQFAPMAPRIAAAVAQLSKQPLRYVLNTHWHGDHTGGNEHFGRQGYVIIAHDNVRTRMGAGHFNRFFNRSVPPSPVEALPVITFSDNMTFYFNGDTVRVVHIPRAHTDGDAVFYFEQADVLHAGDVFVLYGYPFIDLASGGSVKGMIDGLERVLGLIGEETIVIPGHGKLADRARVAGFRDMLVTARSRVTEQVRAGKTADDVVAANPLADLDAAWGQGFIKAGQFIRIIIESEQGG